MYDHRSTTPFVKMHASHILTAVFTLLGSALAAPSQQPQKRCTAILENDPWTLSNIYAFDAFASSNQSSVLFFHFCDTNTGLEMDTDCTRTIAPGGGSTISPGTYYECNNNTVRYIYDGASISIERSYVDEW